MSKQSRRPGRRARRRATYQTRPIKSGGPKYEYTNARRRKTQTVLPGSTGETRKHNRVHGIIPVQSGWEKPGTGQLFRKRRSAMRRYKISDALPVLVRIIGHKEPWRQ